MGNCLFEFSLELPAWVAECVATDARCADDEAKMRLAIRLSAENVRQGTGGPFGAVVFEEESGRVVSVGMNLVTSRNCSVAHAEMVAIMLGQQACETYRLGSDGGQEHFVLVSSAQPCAMCYGAIPWSGVTRLICGARKCDVEALAGFDEGPLPVDWVAALERRGISVRRDVLREEACAVLRGYAELQGTVY